MSEAVGPNRSNRRITSRRACLLIVRYRAESEWRPATAMDISPHGCRLRVGEDLAKGKLVTILFETPLRDGAQATSVEVPGAVQWSRLEGLSYQAGVHFAGCPDGVLEILGALS
jgi:PilZ domain-containing protein